MEDVGLETVLNDLCEKLTWENREVVNVRELNCELGGGAELNCELGNPTVLNCEDVISATSIPGAFTCRWGRLNMPRNTPTAADTTRYVCV